MTDELEQKIKDRQFFLAGTVERLEGRQAVIKTEDGQRLTWPIANLPEETAEGAAVRLILSTAATDQAEREQTAKTILNEILKTDD